MNRSIDILQRVMAERGYDFTTLNLPNSPFKFTQIHDKDGRPALILTTDNPLYPFPTSSARLISRDKMIAYDFVAHNNVAVPRSVIVGVDETLTQALELLKESNEVIVKPVKGAGGHGLTLDVTSRERLEEAIGRVHRDGVSAVVQQQFFGEEVRFAVVDGKVKAALLRQKPRVVGDGKLSVRQLIEHENEARRNIVDTMVPYPQLDQSIIGQDALMDDTVLMQGEVRELSKSTMVRGGASVYNVTDSIDESYVRAAEQAVEGLGDGFVVVDMMIQDYTQPQLQDGYVFIEFNLAPALSLFYSCRDGNHIQFAEDYLGPMLESVIERRNND